MILRSFQIGFLLLLLSSMLVIASETSNKNVQTERSGYWTYYCINDEKQKECNIARKINIEEKNETFLIIYKITKDINLKIKESLNITTPSASRVNINKRLKISFDNKTKFTRSFLKCERDSCWTKFGGSGMLKYSLKNFKEIKITFYALEDEKPISLTLPIDGFKQALAIINQKI